MSVIALAIACSVLQVGAKEEPFLGGYLECALGPKPRTIEVFAHVVQKGVGVRNADGSPSYNPVGDGRPTANQPFRVGYMGWKVGNTALADQACLVLETDAMRTRQFDASRNPRTSTLIKEQLKKFRKVWLTPEGKILREYSSVEYPQGVYSIDAKYNDEEISYEWRTPKESRQLNLFPKDGPKAFSEEFRPMVEGEKVLVAEKNFMRLDPLTGTAKSYKVKVAGRFQGKVFGRDYKGHRIDFECDGVRQSAMISYDGILLQVDLPNNNQLLIEIDPKERGLGIGKVGGGG